MVTAVLCDLSPHFPVPCLTGGNECHTLKTRGYFLCIAAFAAARPPSNEQCFLYASPSTATRVLQFWREN